MKKIKNLLKENKIIISLAFIWYLYIIFAPTPEWEKRGFENEEKFDAFLADSIANYNDASSGPDACDCVEQYNYWSQDDGMYKMDKDLLLECTEYYRDKNADYYPEDINTAKKNAINKCDN